MALTLELAQTVAIGAFNPYVITPEWLVRFGICTQAEGEEINIRLVAIGDGAAFRFGTVDWQVDNQRLSVSTGARDFDCGRAVARVLELLPHTPVQAVGNNFHFSATKEDWAARPSPTLGRLHLDDIEGAEQVRWAGVLRRGDAKIEATLAYEQDAVAILFNHHRTMNLEMVRRATRAEEQVAEARSAAEKFREDFGLSRELLRSYFEMEMPDE